MCRCRPSRIAVLAFLLVVLVRLGFTQEVHERTIRLHPQQGEAITIGTLQLTPDGDDYAFQVSLAEQLFSDQFLSMRPFKCLEGPEEMLCHLPYTYENTRRITSEDLVDLEYDLLFIRKSPTDYGINAWNGLYYQLRWVGDDIEGELYEVDLNVLAAPPAPGNRRPIDPSDLSEADPDSHWLPQITIR